MSQYDKKTKIGKVSIEQHLGAFRLRFTYPKGRRHEIRLPNESDESYNQAIKRALQINIDIENNCFDFDYRRYKPKLSENFLGSLQKEKINLVDIWNP